MELVDTDRFDEAVLREVYRSCCAVNNAKIFLKALYENNVKTAVVIRNFEGKVKYFAGLRFMIAPLPTAVTLPPKQAMHKALAALQLYLEDYPGLSLSELPLSVRTYLVQSNDFKLHIGQSAATSPDFSWWVRSFYYPKWIWVTEFSNYHDFPDPVTRKVSAAVVVDSSAPVDTLDFLLMHVSGLVIPVYRHCSNIVDVLKQLGTGELPVLDDPSFLPYEQFSRK
jgi:hypothetical protein